MGWLDNVIAAVSPRRAYEREMWRQGLDELRGYDAAGYGRINSGWRVHNESAEITDRYSRDVVRGRGTWSAIAILPSPWSTPTSATWWGKALPSAP